MQFRTVVTASVLALVLAGCNRDAADGAGVPAAAADAGDVFPDVAAPPEEGLTATAYTAPGGQIAGGGCSLDGVDGQAVTMDTRLSGPGVLLGGWATPADATTAGEARLVLASAEGAYSVPIIRDVERPDVAAALGDEAALRSGFNVRLSTAGLPAGDYVLQVAFDGGSHCTLRDRIAVAP